MKPVMIADGFNCLVILCFGQISLMSNSIHVDRGNGNRGARTWIDSRIVYLAVLVAILWCGSATYCPNAEAEDPDAGAEGIVSVKERFDQLKLDLEERGFAVALEPPPLEGAYGMLESSSRRIWIHPIVFELGIAVPVLIHEGVHAAQVCAGNGTVAALNLDIDPPNSTRPFFLRYHSYRRNIEAEAYTVQVQPDAYERVGQLLEQHC